MEASGVERSPLAKIERGEVDEPRPDTLRKLAKALGVEVLDLLYGETSVGVLGVPDGLSRGPKHHRNITDTSP
jgi:transcriptional regulator with XRE-family HTH domain